MKKNSPVLLIIFLLIWISFDSYGQRWKLQRYEAGVGLGSVHFHGDIGPAHQEIKNFIDGSRYNITGNFRFRIKPYLAANLELGYLTFSGTDIEGESHSRVYHFTSRAFEHTVRAEYYILGEQTGYKTTAQFNRKGMVNNFNTLNLYVFAGAGGIMVKGKVHDLNNNEEEPVYNPGYNNNLHYGAVFPLGVGLKFIFDSNWSIGMELAYRFTTTDYIDSYASAYSKFNDTYYTTSLKAIYKIRNDARGVPKFLRRY